VTDIGGTTNISVARPVGAPAYIYGAPTAWMKFPAGILPSAEYTLFYVARYNGAAKKRIFQSVNTNWLSGFWEGRAGIVHHSSCEWITSLDNVHGLDWVMGVDRSGSFRSNGLDRTKRFLPCSSFGSLAINTGAASGETSDFAVQSVLVYNRKLSEADVMKVEAWLAFQQSFTPATLQVYIMRICFSIVIYTLNQQLTIVYRALSASMTRVTLLPAAATAPGLLVRALSGPSRAQPASAATAGS
jgi:hypothetical protein